MGVSDTYMWKYHKLNFGDGGDGSNISFPDTTVNKVTSCYPAH